MRRYKQLLLANKAWVAEAHADENPGILQPADAFGQRPEFLWTGCSTVASAPNNR